MDSRLYDDKLGSFKISSEYSDGECFSLDILMWNLTFVFWTTFHMSSSLYRMMIWHHFITSVFHQKFLAGMSYLILINTL